MSGEVIVIGGGPGGIACAAALRRRGIGVIVLEAGDRSLAALRGVDPDMRLVSPARLSRLAGMNELDGAETYLRVGDWIERATAYARRQGVAIETGREVIAVRRDGRELIVVTTRGELRAGHVVDASGQLRWPRLPDGFDPAATDLRWVHARDLRTADLAAAHHLLIVGGRTSAAETLRSWLRVRPLGGQAWLSRRTRHLVTPHRILGIDVHYWVWPLEQVPLPAGRRPPHPLTFGGVLLGVRWRRHVHAVGEITRWSRHSVTVGDTALAPDLIVFATGYRHAAPHLGDLVERHPDGEPRLDACRSRIASGLWLLGVPGARTAASAFLRGIAADAEHVAAQIAAEAAR